MELEEVVDVEQDGVVDEDVPDGPVDQVGHRPNEVRFADFARGGEVDAADRVEELLTEGGQLTAAAAGHTADAALTA